LSSLEKAEASRSSTSKCGPTFLIFLGGTTGRCRVISDGRSASPPDRASHSSLSWGNPAGDAALYGMTDQPAESLAVLARSWNDPPAMVISGPGYDYSGYDYTLRAYRVKCGDAGRPLQIDIAASETSPVHNLVLVVDN
jgi:hypothetical protein